MAVPDTAREAVRPGRGSFRRAVAALFPEARQLERRRRLRYALLVLLAGGLVVGVLRATDPGSRVLPPSPRAASPNLGSVELAGTYRAAPDLMAATGGRFFGGSLNEATKRFTVLRIDGDGSVMRNAVPDRRAWWFSQMAVAGHDLFIATDVDKRFTTAANELVRLNTSNLRETGGMTLPSGVLAIVAAHRTVWVALTDRILRIDARTLSIDSSYSPTGTAPPPPGSTGIYSLALSQGTLWATYGASGRTWLYRMDPNTLKVTSRLTVPERGQTARVVAGPQSTWLAGEDFARPVAANGHLGKPTEAHGLQTEAVKGHTLLALIYTGSSDETLVQLDERGNLIVRSRVGDAGAKIAVDGRSVWLLHGLRLAHWLINER